MFASILDNTRLEFKIQKYTRECHVLSSVIIRDGTVKDVKTKEGQNNQFKFTMQTANLGQLG